ncbi:MAG: GNAT family N-acetyltransferase [Eudoraea sp.]|nr:GNAT family N-acetyltransferase [Eudoraea sp.]
MPSFIKRLNFFYDFYEKCQISSIYSRCPAIYFEFQNGSQEKRKNAKSFIAIVNCIPPYLGITREHLGTGLRCFQSSYRLGFAMDLSHSETPRDFLRNQLGKKVFKNLRQDRQRLERNHQISFKIYHGSISREIYDNLMDTLKRFIEIRFKGRTSKHAALKRWDDYQNSVFDQINLGNASFFVLSVKNKPIAIDLNYHYKNILYAAIIGYDTQFYRYSPGRQMFFRLVEWCLSNNYDLIDMGWGPFEYKIKFSNAVYAYSTQVIYPSKNVMYRFLSFIIINLIEAKYYLAMVRRLQTIRPHKTFQGRWLNYTLDRK